jgi:hypothetical protein
MPQYSPKFPDPSNTIYNIKVVQFEVEYEEVFHLKELYKRIKDWTGEWNYKSVDDDLGEVESLYFERVLPSGALEHHIWWRFEKKFNNMIKFFIKFDYQTLNANKVEVMHKGKKANTNKLDLIIRVEGWIIIDNKHEFRKHWLFRYFEHWFFKRWYRKEIEAYKKRLWFEVYHLEDTIKHYLTLNTRDELAESFHPQKGL